MYYYIKQRTWEEQALLCIGLTGSSSNVIPFPERVLF